MARTTDNRPEGSYRSQLGIALQARGRNTHGKTARGASSPVHHRSGMSYVERRVTSSPETHRRLQDKKARQPHYPRESKLVNSRYVQPALHMPDPLSMTCPTTVQRHQYHPRRGALPMGRTRAATSSSIVVG